MESDNDDKGLISESDIKNLSNGLLEIYQEPLSKVKSSLLEVTTKQLSLINSVNVQNQRLSAIQNNEGMKAMFSDINYCREQLTTIKKQMLALHDRSNRLRVRAQNVLACANNRKRMRSAELANEQNLIGRNS